MNGTDMIEGHKTAFAVMAVMFVLVLAVTFYLARAGKRRINRTP